MGSVHQELQLGRAPEVPTYSMVLDLLINIYPNNHPVVWVNIIYIYWLVVSTCFNHLEKYESQWEGILWKIKCSKPPTSIDGAYDMGIGTLPVRFT